MKTYITKLAACAVALAFVASLHASYLQFSLQQGNGVQSNQVVGDIPIDNPGMLASANNVTAPAISVSMLLFSPFGSALYECRADTNVATGNYLVGDFYSGSGGSECYLYIY